MPAAKILVIEDNLPDVEILRFALKEHGEPFELEILNDGEAALQFVREIESGVRAAEPCVILLDLHLPKQDGLTVLDAIREAPALRDIKVMVLTGGGTSPKKQDEIVARGAVLRQKPADLSEFATLSREILDLCSAPA